MLQLELGSVAVATKQLQLCSQSEAMLSLGRSPLHGYVATWMWHGYVAWYACHSTASIMKKCIRFCDN